MQRQSLSSTRFIRSYNAASLLQTLYRQGSCSRADLAAQTKISSPTVSRIVAELIDQGVVVAENLGPSTGGRRPLMLKLDHTKLYVVGVQLERDRVTLALANIHGGLISRRSYRPHALDPHLLLQELAKEVNTLIAQDAVLREHILGVGIAISGVIDRSGAQVRVRSVSLGWRDVEVARHLEALLQLPVYVENDANAGALAELWFGQARSVQNSLYLKTEPGVGAGIIINQRLFNAPRGMAGEIGHVALVKNGRKCRCGQTGCLEPYVSMQDVLHEHAKRTGESCDVAGFFHRATNGDSAADNLVAEAIQALTLTLSLAAALLDLDMIIVGGSWGKADANYLSVVQKHIQATLVSTGLTREVVVVGSSLATDSDLLGAVGLVIDRWFNCSMGSIAVVG